MCVSGFVGCIAIGYGIIVYLPSAKHLALKFPFF